MRCQKCGHPKLKITHVYRGGESVKIQRAACPKCFTVHTLQTVVTDVDPTRGQGAATVARKMREQTKEGAV